MHIKKMIIQLTHQLIDDENSNDNIENLRNFQLDLDYSTDFDQRETSSDRLIFFRYLTRKGQFISKSKQQI
ncbi:hypothetical protein TTHERM_01137150 (macronuclear) [Tetrahymena thermophila SB210]|uniref:Uncharacterized protein n=1 Tax=Tetrahymena thermophila (strain SB210) TaxID=312017 RepID=Q235S2_TETTS|nr:hypothetical protein TTHERM_01137150 [Tetrahymena thermophila SB210]EAR92284.1 hypothetical protein TTHERM_01137150 [Tetrahymena thermophila SB210]|eukprot:XP_001012529.1 hypothetical protein TTHERM_01137150 [Tetrahymena thermophila SB210]